MLNLFMKNLIFRTLSFLSFPIAVRVNNSRRWQTSSAAKKSTAECCMAKRQKNHRNHNKSFSGCMLSYIILGKDKLKINYPLDGVNFQFTFQAECKNYPSVISNSTSVKVDMADGIFVLLLIRAPKDLNRQDNHIP